MIFHTIDRKHYAKEYNQSKRYSSTRFVPVSRKELYGTVNKNYKLFMDFLEENKFITPFRRKTDNKLYFSIKDGKSAKYSIHKRFEGKEISFFWMTSLSKPQLKYFDERSKKKAFEIQNNYLNFRFDIDAAIIDWKERYSNSNDEDEKQGLINQIRIMVNIYNQVWKFKTCEYGRLHSSLTTLHKEFRKYLYIPDCQASLVNLDIQCSQINFLLLFLRNNGFKKDHQDIIKLTNIISNDFYKYFMERDTEGVILNEYDNRDNEVVEDNIGHIKVFPFQNISTSDLRGKYKKAVFHRIYGQLDDKCRFCQIFKEEMPEVYSFLKSFKNVKNEYTDEVTGRTYLKSYAKAEKRKYKGEKVSVAYSRLAHHMQIAESDFVIRTIAPQLKYFGIDFLTIHDSFLIKETDKEIVYNIFRKGLDSIGLEHTVIETEELHNPNIVQDDPVDYVDDYNRDNEDMSDYVDNFPTKVIDDLSRVVAPTIINDTTNQTKVDLPVNKLKTGFKIHSDELKGKNYSKILKQVRKAEIRSAKKNFKRKENK
jgi:hypothetical protein